MSELNLIARAHQHGDAVALQCGTESFSYGDLLARSESVAAWLLAGEDDLNEARIGCLIPGGIDYVAAQWGIWRAGGVFVPLSLSATGTELEYVISDSQCSSVVVTRELADSVAGVCDDLNVRIVVVEEAVPKSAKAGFPQVDQ